MLLAVSYLFVVHVKGHFSGEEEDARNGGGNGALQGLDRQRGDLLRRRLRTLQPILDHIRLEDAALEVHVRIRKSLELRRKNTLSRSSTGEDVVVAVGNDLRFDNRHQALALADGSVAGKVRAGFLRRVRVRQLWLERSEARASASIEQRPLPHLNGQITRQTLRRIYLKDVTPLGEARSASVRVGGTLLQVVDSSAERLGEPRSEATS